MIDSENKVLVFIHIPKTAGTTFHHILTDIYADKNHFCSHGNGVKQLNKLYRLSKSEMAKIDVIRGHQNYGVHQIIDQSCIYITFLRNPVDRLVSHYIYLQNNPYHPLCRIFRNKPFSFVNFLEKAVDNDNGQVRALCGLNSNLPFCKSKKVGFGSVTDHHFELAKRRLESLLWFGLQERFDDSVILLKHTLNWDLYPYYAKANITKQEKRVAISDRELEVATKLNRYDIKLYNHAKSLFEKRVIHQGEPFKIEKELFCQLNSKCNSFKKAIDNYHTKDLTLQAEYQKLQSEYQALKSRHRELLNSKIISINNQIRKLIGKRPLSLFL